MAKILYFTADAIPTADEQAEIDRLNALAIASFSEVGVRNANALRANHTPEDADYVAGSIPQAYNAYVDYGDADADKPLLLQSLPASASIAEVVETEQLQILSVSGADLLRLNVADVTGVNTVYASSNELIATVDAGGLITAVAPGECTITATHSYAQGKTEVASIAVTVTAVSLTLVPATAEIAVAATQQLQAVFSFGNTDVTATDTTYASDNEAVATVDANGLITGVGAGSCTITATHTYAVGKTVQGTCAVTVPA